MTHYERILNALKLAFEDRETEDVVYIHNACSNNFSKLTDKYIENMKSFDEIMQSAKPSEIARMAIHGNFDPYDTYFIINAHGNLTSFNDWRDDGSPVEVAAIAQYIYMNLAMIWASAKLPKSLKNLRKNAATTTRHWTMILASDKEATDDAG